MQRPHQSNVRSSSSASSRLCFHADRGPSSLRQRRCLCCSVSDKRPNATAARDVVAAVEQVGAPTNAAPAAAAASSKDSSSKQQEQKYKALLAIILKLIDQEKQQQQQQQQQVQGQEVQQRSDQQQQVVQKAAKPQQQQQQQQQQQDQRQWQRLESFLRSQPAATSIPFIGWLADREAAAAGAHKAQLAQLCEVLVLLREQQDREGQEALYADTLRLLSGGDEQALALMSSDPRQYALALAEGMSGQPLQLQGYGAAYDALLVVAPAAALTPEAVAKGHDLAEELGQDLSSRRKSTVAAMLGRVQLDSLSPEQQAALLGPSPAARILDLLLSLPGGREARLALLPDCFTPPAEAEAAAAAAAAAAGEEDGETDELWCTPMQLLNEVDRRLSSLAAAAAAAQAAAEGQQQQQQRQERGALPGATNSSSSSSSHVAALPPREAAGMSEAELTTVLQELRQHIQDQWLDSLPRSS